MTNLIPPPPFSESTTQLSPWVTVVERQFGQEGALQGAFHSLRLHDYVTVLALTKEGKVPLVRQFRPALGRFTLELPGGLLDADISPQRCAELELEEEVGYRVPDELESLGCFDPDTGRLENRLWGFFAQQVEEVPNWAAEPGVERVHLNKNELVESIATGQFTAALHIALVGVARLRGRI